jgi:hypothetical protein
LAVYGVLAVYYLFNHLPDPVAAGEPGLGEPPASESASPGAWRP